MLAWWDGTYRLPSAGPMLSRWAASEFSTDWGTRDISNQTPFYDPISYHQGSIWPLFTGWVSLAEYRNSRSLSGFAHLMQNVNLTWAQDLGSVTDLLSGDFYQPLGRSSSHQMWSSAMVISPLLRGLFGIGWDALNHTLTVAPQLPANWQGAKLHNILLGSTVIDLNVKRQGEAVTIEAKSRGNVPFCLQASSEPRTPCHGSATQTVTVSTPPLQISVPTEPPGPGATTSQLKVMEEAYTDRRATFTFEGLAGHSYYLPVRTTRAHITVEGASLSDATLHVKFPTGIGYQKQKVVISW